MVLSIIKAKGRKTLKFPEYTPLIPIPDSGGIQRSQPNIVTLELDCAGQWVALENHVSLEKV